MCEAQEIFRDWRMPVPNVYMKEYILKNLEVSGG